MKNPIDFGKALRSFRYAWEGLAGLMRSENNARIHLLATLLVVAAGFFFEITVTEWCLVVVVIALVWAGEAFNTAIEKLADVVSPDKHPTIKVVKDVAAAGVLILALLAVVVGLLIFLPKLIALSAV
jgi:diacylglycerol kinase